ncbi:Thrombospondin-3 [Bienertia sinuspersici]
MATLLMIEHPNSGRDTLQHKEAANMESDKSKTNEEVYFEVVGGFDAKGRIYGIGSTAESYFEKPNSIKTTTKASSQHVMNLENQVTQLTSTNKQQQELLDSTVEQMKLLQKQFEILSQQVTGCSPPHPHPLLRVLIASSVRHFAWIDWGNIIIFQWKKTL